jgi:phosphoglucosamine mutase
MRETGQPLSALASCMTRFPQVLVNVRVREKPPLESIPGLADRQATRESELGATGRILVRYSGTENLARVMIEGEDRVRIESIASELLTIIKKAVGA